MNKILKPLLFFLPVICLLCYSCSRDEDQIAENLMIRIEALETEIEMRIENSTGSSSDDCRTRFLGGGDGCGPFYTYGIEGIDTVQLESLFQELERAKTDLFNLQGGPVCDVIAPATDSLINGQCRLCYGDIDTGELECF